ncbi:MAG: MBOAT family O-acyltransferase [Lachnospiraceae bacterium]
MVFSSFVFLFRFLPITLLVYYIAPGKCKNLVLFLASLFFYAWGEPVYLCLMLFSTIFDYGNGLLLEYCHKKEKAFPAKAVLVLSVVGNLSLLFVFKYLPIDLPLPIGISFYTFQTMSYTIDVYRRQCKVQHNIIDFGTYVSMFPQLIAGPIVRYQTVEQQLRHRSISVEQISYGIWRFVIGLGKKVLLANQFGSFYEQMGQSIPGILFYGFQIYFDFSGYSDMAIGLAAMFGFSLPENFRYPYMANSITDFWRRWHISLGTWFREYVYIPLGGNRKGLRRQIVNLLIVWSLTGIWHGASMNFLLWGLYFGMLLMVEKMIGLSNLERIPGVLRHLYTVILVFTGWTLFTAADGKTWSWSADMSGGWLYLLILGVVGSTTLPVRLGRWMTSRWSSNVCFCLKTGFTFVVFLLCVAALINTTYNPFLYFRF